MPKQELSTPERLRKLRDDFSDEIPPRIVHSSDPDNRYKVRRNWWTGLIATLELGLENGVFPEPERREEIERFIEYYFHRPNFFDRPLTSEQDILGANRLINIALGESPTKEIEKF